MKAVLVSGGCFVIGAVCGGLLFKPKSPGATEPDPARSGIRSSLGSAIPGQNSRDGSSGQAGDGASAGEGGNRASRTGRRVSTADLLELANRNYSPSSMIELYRATGHLGPDALLELAGEIEKLPPQDQRTWQLRGVVLARFAQVDPDAAIAHASSIPNRNIRQQALSSVVGEIARSDLSKAASILRGIEDLSEFQQVANALASSNADGAPELLLTLLKERKGANLEWGYSNMFAQWARKDFQSAVANLDQIPVGQQRNVALQGIGNAIVGENFDAGLEFLQSLSNPAEKSQVLSSIVNSIASSDPHKALALLEEHGDRSQWYNLLGNISSNWMGSDPDGARAWIETLENPRDRTSALQHLVYNIGDNTEWLAAQVSGLPSNSQTQNLISNLAQRWGQLDPQAAAEWVQTLAPGQAKQWARQNLMSHWAQSDPAAAAAALSDEPIGPNDGASAGQIASQWIGTDPDAALAWIDSLDASPNMRHQMLSTMVSSWARSDPDAAAAYALGLDGDERTKAISSLTSSWASSDFDSAEAWVAGIGDEEIRYKALNSLIAGSAYNDPQRAADALAEAISGMSEEEASKTFSSAANRIANSWAQSDPVAAATWAVDHPDPKTRPNLLQGIVQQWARYEPTAASEWLTTFEPGPDRDGAIGGLVSTIQNDDPEAAFAWAATIDNDHSRSSYVRQAVNQWRSSDPGAARAAVQSADLSEDLRKSLLESLGNE
ncbi:MAG: hypothetical protein ACR2RV_06780 [Verrucomicrobiales bacterium]